MRKSNINLTSVYPQFNIEFESGFILLFAFIYFFDESGFVSALFPAVIVHELGHVLAMLIFGAHPTRLKASLAGFRLDYSGNVNETQDMLIALAGPLFGFIFSFLCARIGQYHDSEYLLMCAGLGFILNIFNLLPAMSLDGGRILNYILTSALGPEKAVGIIGAVGLIIVFILLFSGLYSIATGYGFSLFFAGIWLFILQQNKACK